MDKKKILIGVGIGIAALALLFTNETIRTETIKVIEKTKEFFKK